MLFSRLLDFPETGVPSLAQDVERPLIPKCRLT
ncbi:hypothetical protein Cwoe_3277 [Conexibacter woesei DSM 14684]|uniref:Uncharacterized protein n=1 Tax=Conexibacter woesei (strain DSM 14684 / CCUG 47730 / CIP 108061 / JCM 11494 / NBRC 100937 / ID131577) TaxID=469383 RepID=D3FEX8_CONWI|nr:hypothetical protein Cwoe_3277 [Conexibacter woesei DSM 14684]